MKVFPPLKPDVLSSIDPGALVIYGNAFAFVTSVEGQGTVRELAIFNGADKKFMRAVALSAHELLVRIVGELVIEPDFEFGTVEVRTVSLEDTSTIFIRDRDVFGALDMGTKIDPKPTVFQLGTGEVKYPVGHMAACSPWRLGVRENPTSKPRWLIKVPPSPHKQS